MDIFNFLSALSRSDDESDPYVVHKRALYRLSGSPDDALPTIVAMTVTEQSHGDYLIVYAADAFGGVNDFLVASRSCCCQELADVLERLKDEPQSTCGSGELPQYVVKWLQEVGCESNG